MAFLTIGPAGDLRVLAARRLSDEVSPTGVEAAAWEADVVCLSDAEASAVRAITSHNLRRTLSWQLRGTGYGDVSVSGDLVGGVLTARIEVAGDIYAAIDDSGTWRRVLTLRIREQVAP